MLAATDPATMKLDEKIAPIDLSTETAVAEWFRALLARGVNFHPKESFAELVNGETGRPLFGAEDAERLDALMGIAYEVCDPCALAVRLVRGTDTDPARPCGDDSPPAMRESEQGSKIDVTLIRSFLRSALGDDAVIDKVNNLIFDAVAGGGYHRTVVAESLPGYINEILNTATEADWQAVADDLLAEGHELLSEGGG
ncbi:MAG: hypothetical protein E6G51_06485 [Actinobacteria bacterium]|nr:MAG: hypothetical protein E6G51_06485 [Actinomycetota bacterium]